jgi:magnesium chelatase family protein
LLDRGTLSTRGLDRVLRLAWTLADLAGRDAPGPDEVVEAESLRRGYSLTAMPHPDPAARSSTPATSPVPA